MNDHQDFVRQFSWKVHICARRGPNGECFDINGTLWSAANDGPIGAIKTLAKLFNVKPLDIMAASADPDGDERNLVIR